MDHMKRRANIYNNQLSIKENISINENTDLKKSSKSIDLRLLSLAIIAAVCLINISCSIYRKPLDKYTMFSEYLDKTEEAIDNDNWEEAGNNLENARKSWRKVKPLLQIDIDHDYINEIEESFSMLQGYIKTKEKPDATAFISKIREIWLDIGQM